MLNGDIDNPDKRLSVCYGLVRNAASGVDRLDGGKDFILATSNKQHATCIQASRLRLEIEREAVLGVFEANDLQRKAEEKLWRTQSRKRQAISEP